MASIIKYTLFEPIVTGSLLYVLTRGSPDLRARVLSPLARLPFKVEPDVLIKALQALLAAGVLGRINNWLSKWALNNWQFGYSGRPWIWKDEVAVITGGSGGIATEVIKKLAPTGMKIAVLDIAPPPAPVKDFPNVHFYKTDITDSASVHEVAEAVKRDLGVVTILLNNAGIGSTFSVTTVPDAYLEKIFHINLISHWYTVREFLPGMIAAKKGHVVTTASMASYTAVAGMVDYCCTKAGAMAFHEGLTQELKHRYNAPYIRTTCVHPYWVQTALIQNWNEKSLKSKKFGQSLLTPQYVGGKIADAVLSGKSSRIQIPDKGIEGLMMNLAPGARGWPAWAHALVNDGTAGDTH